MSLGLTPAGQLRWAPRDDDAIPPVLSRLQPVFDADWREALFTLAADRIDTRESPAVRYWQEIAQRYLTALCHLPEKALSIQVMPPAPADCAGWILAAPPMHGGEYLSADNLQRIWTQLDEWVRATAATLGGLSALLRARELLRESGWTVRDGVLTNDAGEPFTLSFIVRNRAELRSITQYVDQLERLGFRPRVRMVETSQYIRLMEDFDFDISEHGYWTAQPAGVEVVSYWHSSNALLPHVRNRSGIRHEAVDEMLMRVLNARSRAELTAAQRALDRVLLWNFYMIPLVAAEGPRVVYWDKFGRPPNDSEYRTNFPDAWWYDETKAARIGVAN